MSPIAEKEYSIKDMPQECLCNKEIDWQLDIDATPFYFYNCPCGVEWSAIIINMLVSYYK